jgi:hypothetical protein
MMDTGARSKRFFAVVVVLAALTLAAAAPAQAGPRVTCEATGHVNVAPTSPGWAWQVDGFGLCVDFLNGPWQIALSGTGTSDTLGLCDGLVVTSLDLDVTVTFLNLKTGRINAKAERWFAPVSIFPVATPFFITGGGAGPGVGTMFTRILLGCPPGGLNTATFVFNQLS